MNVYSQIETNKKKSFLIISLFVLFTTTVIYILGRAFGSGPEVILTAFLVSGLSSILSYYYSDKIVLAISQARPAKKNKDFTYFTVVENLSMASQIPMPKLYVIEDTAPNAFATGRDPQHAVICVTTGLLSKLDRTELEGVIGHELTHIKNYDMRLMTITAVLAGVITLLADWFLRVSFWGERERDQRNSQNVIFGILAVFFSILSPIIAQLIKLAISRQREFYADAGSAFLTRQPEGLIRALTKISADHEPLEAANKATAHLYIVNPLRNTHNAIGWFANLFNTHPPIEERIKALKKLI